MALKFLIKTVAYNALSDDLKKEYIAGDNEGEFTLDVSDLPKAEDVGPIKRALEAEKTKNKELKTKFDDAQAKIAEFPNIDELKAKHDTDVKKYKAFTEQALIDGAAQQLASKISTATALITPHIKARLIADMSGDVPVTKVKGADGKVSEMTLEDLGKEFVANKDFAPIIVGSKARGSGAPLSPIKASGGGAPTGDDKPQNLSTMSGPDLVARIAARKEASQQQQ